jgi:outer membrane protein OmpA-like peptidoglycan-associated protein
VVSPEFGNFQLWISQSHIMVQSAVSVSETQLSQEDVMKFSTSRVGMLLAVMLLCATVGVANAAAPHDGAAAWQSATPAQNPSAAPDSTPAQNPPADQNAAPAQNPPSSSASSSAPPKSHHMHKKMIKGHTNDDAPAWTPMPAWNGGLGLFTVQTGETLPKGGMSFSAGVNKFSRAPGSVSILDVGGFNVGVGLTDWLSVYMQFDPDRHVHVGLPGQLSLNTPTTGAFQQYRSSPYRSIFPIVGARPAYVEDDPFVSQEGGGYGDVVAGLTLGVLSEDRGKPFTLSIDNEFFVPTVNSLADVLNDETQSGQLDYQIGVNISKRLANNNFLLTAGYSYRFTPDAVFHGVNVFSGGPQTIVLGRADQERLDVGYILFPNKRIQFMNEYNGLIFTGNSTANTTFGPRDPVDGIWGFRLYPLRWLAFDVGYRYMLNLSQVNDRSGFVIKVGAAYWPEKPKAPDVVTASCSVDKSTIVADSGEMIEATAQGSDTYNHPINYTWTATGGRVDGSGPQVRWQPADAAPGTYTISAHLDDNRGNSASCSSDVTVQPKPAPPPPTMSCSANPSSIQVGERATVTATVNDSTGTALTYSWQANSGQVVGTGASVQFDSTGLAPGDYTVTGRVENAKDGAADCTATVTVQQPPAKPEASKIGQCYFKPGSARVDNVCKRVLDDAAVRLQNDPKAKIVIVGYADPKERKPDQLAKQRADSALTYLSKTKNVDASRVETRGAAGTAGADKENRRADVVNVPDGASY